MSRRNRRGRSFYRAPQGQTIRSGNTLSDRAVITSLLYNHLQEVTPEAVDGLKRAQIKVKDSSIESRPLQPKEALVEQMYGMKPTIIAKPFEPTALITRYSPEDPKFDELEEFNNTLLRRALRRIVDEA